MYSTPGVLLEFGPLESIKHSSISRLAKLRLPDIVEACDVVFSLPSTTKGAAKSLKNKINNINMIKKTSENGIEDTVSVTIV